MKFLNKFRFPGIGMRNLKTVLAVLICMTGYALFGQEMPLFACVAVVICMQDTVENTVQYGLSRLLGTFIGGGLGIGFLWLSQLSTHIALLIFLSGVGVCVAIYLSVLLNRPLSCTISSTVFLIIMLAHSNQPFLYALNRILETGFGVIVAVVINRFINPKISHTGGALKWSWKIARTDLEEGYTLRRLSFRRNHPPSEEDGEKEEQAEKPATPEENPAQK